MWTAEVPNTIPAGGVTIGLLEVRGIENLLFPRFTTAHSHASAAEKGTDYCTVIMSGLTEQLPENALDGVILDILSGASPLGRATATVMAAMMPP